MAVIETTVFKLAPGADELAFLHADRRVQTELMPLQKGFLRRTTARGTQGEWLVMVLWYTDTDAEAAASHSRGHPAMAELMELVEPGTVLTKRYATLD